MAAKIGPQIGIDGYKEYRDNMARILAQLAALDAAAFTQGQDIFV